MKSALTQRGSTFGAEVRPLVDVAGTGARRVVVVAARATAAAPRQALASAHMPFGRRKHDSKRRDPFEHLAEERHAAESGEPWFLGPDDAPELDVEAGISSNLSDEDLDQA